MHRQTKAKVFLFDLEKSESLAVLWRVMNFPMGKFITINRAIRHFDSCGLNIVERRFFVCPKEIRESSRPVENNEFPNGESHYHQQGHQSLRFLWVKDS